MHLINGLATNIRIPDARSRIHISNSSLDPRVISGCLSRISSTKRAKLYPSSSRYDNSIFIWKFSEPRIWKVSHGIKKLRLHFLPAFWSYVLILQGESKLYPSFATSQGFRFGRVKSLSIPCSSNFKCNWWDFHGRVPFSISTPFISLSLSHLSIHHFNS